MFEKYILEFIKGASIGITILFAILGVASATHIAEDSTYYENGIKTEDTKHHKYKN